MNVLKQRFPYNFLFTLKQQHLTKELQEPRKVSKPHRNSYINVLTLSVVATSADIVEDAACRLEVSAARGRDETDGYCLKSQSSNVSECFREKGSSTHSFTYGTGVDTFSGTAVVLRGLSTESITCNTPPDMRLFALMTRAPFTKRASPSTVRVTRRPSSVGTDPGMISEL